MPKHIARQLLKHMVLRLRIRLGIGTFQLNPYRKIITTFPARKTGYASVPGTIITGHKLRHSACTLNQKMS